MTSVKTNYLHTGLCYHENHDTFLFVFQQLL